jgi:ribosomal protein L16 Arg81 hydroxylase
MASAQLFIGPPGSGAPFHFHHAAWNLLGFGQKAWLIAPPSRGAFSTKDARQNFRDDVHALEASGEALWRCVQRAGDLLVLPEAWAHATFNLRTSIGIAREFVLPGSHVTLGSGGAGMAGSDAIFDH